MADDLRIVFHKGKELTAMTSYLPYISSMRLAEKSSDSPAVNPSLHYFVHFTGGLMGHIRSLNVRIVGDGNIMDPLFNVQVLAEEELVGMPNLGKEDRPLNLPASKGQDREKMEPMTPMMRLH